jgi:hypothetical protein
MTVKSQRSPSKFDESALLGPVVKLLTDHGCKFVLATQPEAGIERGDEFGVLIPQEAAASRLIDVVGVRWGQTSIVDTVAVECKRERSIRESLNAALGQATDYQTYFHKVFIATEAGEFQDDKRQILQSLGLGHISVDTVRVQAAFSLLPPDFPSTRFSKPLHDQLVAPRLVVLLAFREAFADIPGVLSYGGTRDGGAWVAKSIIEHLQWNAWWDETKGMAYCGVNVERKADIGRIVERVKSELLVEVLERLPPEYRIRVTKDPVPGRSGVPDQNVIRPIEARNVDVPQLLRGLKEVLPDRRWRPHISIHRRIWDTYEKLDRWGYLQRLRQTKEQLGEVMSGLASSLQLE